jgi:hypothetical protein
MCYSPNGKIRLLVISLEVEQVSLHLTRTEAVNG